MVHPDVLGASLASCLGLDVGLLELPELKGLLDEPCPLIRRTGYYPDVEPLGDPCLKIHQTGYYPDVDLWGVVHPDAELRVAELAMHLVWQLPRVLDPQRSRLPLLRQEPTQLESELAQARVAQQLLVFERQEPQRQVLALELGWEQLAQRE